MDIVLIGMPGSGKSVIGRIIAKQLGLPFVDMDDEIEKHERRKISDIFASDGEDYFRSRETECLKRVLGSGRVISTGGGIVVREENAAVIRESEAIVVFIDRPPEKIVGDVRTDTRPLLKDGAERIYRLYKERYDKYMKLSDIRIVNNKSVRDAVAEIVQEVRKA